MNAFLFEGVECVFIAGFAGIVINTRKQKYRDAYNAASVVLQLTDNGEVIAEYPSISIAAKTVGVSDCCIRAVLRGVNKHACGYKWKFKI